MRRQAGQARQGSVTIAFELLGPDDGEPMLLVMGLGMQLVMWPDDFCQGLVERGFTVARFDNRDVGRSTHLSRLGTPNLLTVLTRPGAATPYRLSDMADDARAVMDTLQWRQAHVVGVSMGGMIAQTLAIRQPGRVRSLTSIMSTPSPRVGRPSLRALALLGRPIAGGRERAAAEFVRVFTAIGSPAYPRDEEWLREVGRESFDRGHDPAGPRRQLAAIIASGDRRPALRRLGTPTLVLHGTADPLVRPAGGLATAAAVPRSRLVMYAGMGHDLPRPLWPTMIDEITAVARTGGFEGPGHPPGTGQTAGD